MAETYLCRYETRDSVPTTESFSAIGTINQPIIQHSAVLSLFNQTGSDSVTTLKRLEINELSSRTTTTPNALSLIRTTAQSGGTAVIPIQHDTNDSALPSQISIATYPASVTTTGTAFRVLLGRNTMAPAIALAAFSAYGLGHLKGACSNAVAINRFESDTQAITLREGEGFAITTNNASPPAFPLQVVFRIGVGSASYSLVSVIPVGSQSVLFGLHNGSGSGAVVTIDRLDISELKTTDALSFLTIETIAGVFGGDSLSAVSLDTSNTALPSGVTVRSNATVSQLAGNGSQYLRQSYSGDLPVRRVAVAPFGVSPALASGIIGNLQKRRVAFDFSSTIDSAGGLVLREGQGVAILQRPNFSGYAQYEILALFTNDYSPPAPGGGTTVFNILE